MELLKANFATKSGVESAESKPDEKQEFEKKALENIGGSMVFVDRKRLTYDPQK